MTTRISCVPYHSQAAVFGHSYTALPFTLWRPPSHEGLTFEPISVTPSLPRSRLNWSPFVKGACGAVAACGFAMNAFADTRRPSPPPAPPAALFHPCSRNTNKHIVDVEMQLTLDGVFIGIDNCSMRSVVHHTIVQAGIVGIIWIRGCGQARRLAWSSVDSCLCVYLRTMKWCVGSLILGQERDNAKENV